MDNPRPLPRPPQSMDSNMALGNGLCQEVSMVASLVTQISTAPGVAQFSNTGTVEVTNQTLVPTLARTTHGQGDSTGHSDQEVPGGSMAFGHRHSHRL